MNETEQCKADCEEDEYRATGYCLRHLPILDRIEADRSE